MGAIADNSFNMYGTGKNQIDFAKQLRLSGYVTPQDQMIGSIVEKLPSIFMSLGQKIVDNCGDDISLNNDGELSAKGEEAQKAINDIFEKYGCSSVDELYAVARTKTRLETERENTLCQMESLEVEKCNNECDILENNETIANNNNELINNRNTISSNNRTIGDLKDQLNELGSEDSVSNDIERTRIESQILGLELKNKELETKNKELEDKNKELETKNKELETNMLSIRDKQIPDLEKKLQQIDNELEAFKDINLETINSDIKAVENYQEILRKADGRDGRDVIASMTNNETKDITKIIGKLNKARADGNNEKEQELRQQLTTAFNEYKKNHKEGDNKTIDNLMKQYGVTWTSAS